MKIRKLNRIELTSPLNGYGDSTSKFRFISCHTVNIAQTGSNFEVSGYTLTDLQ